MGIGACPDVSDAVLGLTPGRTPGRMAPSSPAIVAALREAGFDVVGTAASADIALAMAAAGAPELAIMDVRLSGARDGIEAALELYSRFGLRSLFATAHSDPATQARAQPAMPLGWISKPYELEDLIEEILAAAAELRR